MSRTLEGLTPRTITVQRLLAQQAIQAGITFGLDDDPQDVPPLLLFAAAWSQPLVSAYARLLSILSMGKNAHILFPCEFKSSPAAPLGLICTEAPVNGSADGILRAAIVSRAAQEALGFSFFDKNPQRVNFMDVVRRCASEETLAGQALRCQTTQDWVRLASGMTLDAHLFSEDWAADAIFQTNKAQRG